MSGGAALPTDVLRRLQRDFAGETCFEATRLLESLALAPRVLRALLLLADGDFPELERFTRIAERDWREVVFWAEYEDHERSAPHRVRDLEEPLHDPPAEGGGR